MDIDKLREEDRIPVAAVVKYLKDNGLEIEMKGSADYGDLKYDDIDLIAKGNSISERLVNTGLERIARLHFDGTPFVIHVDRQKRVDKEGEQYNRFKISIGQATVDLYVRARFPEYDKFDEACIWKVDNLDKQRYHKILKDDRGAQKTYESMLEQLIPETIDNLQRSDDEQNIDDWLNQY